MNKRVICLTLTGTLAAIVLAGCAGSSPRTVYYSLYAPVRQTAPTAPVDATLVLSVGPVTLPDILKQARIATGGADGRYRLAEYHRWSGEVDRDLARAVAEQVATHFGTEQVAIFPWDQHLTSANRVLVDVLNMGGELGREATLAVRWTLVGPSGKSPVQTRRSDLREVPTDASYPAWVAAQQRNIARLGEEIAGELEAIAGR